MGLILISIISVLYQKKKKNQTNCSFLDLFIYLFFEEFHNASLQPKEGALV